MTLCIFLESCKPLLQHLIITEVPILNLE